MTAGIGAPGLVPDGFRVGPLLGRGGSGTVHEARHAATGRVLALKMLTVDLADAGALRLFERERTVMADLATHPHVVSIVDAGVLGGRPWIAMDLCRRGSLARSGPLPVEAVTTTLHAVASALTAAHARGVIHCDVKPANVLVTDYGQVALGDFGVARLALGSGTGSTAGGYSLDHVAPEVVDGARPTDRADVHSLGTTAWQLLTGRPPFRRPDEASAAAVLSRIRSQPVPPVERPDVPAELGDLIARMTAKAPGDRPSAAEVVAVVEHLARVHALSVTVPMGEVVPPADAPTDLTPSWSGPSSPGWSRSSSGTGVGFTDHRPDLAGFTHGGRPAALAAADPALAAADPGHRRDRVVVAALVALAVVVLACGGLVTARLLPSGAPASVVTTASGEQQVVPAGVTPPGPGVPLEAAGAPELVSADRASTAGAVGAAGAAKNVVAPGAPPAAGPVAPVSPTAPSQPVSSPTPKPVDAKAWLVAQCNNNAGGTCSRALGEIAIRIQVTTAGGDNIMKDCVDDITLTDGAGVVWYQDSQSCNKRGLHAVGADIPDGTYTVTGHATVSGTRVNGTPETFVVGP